MAATRLVPSHSAIIKSPKAAPVISYVSPITRYPPFSESNTHDILQAVAGTASVISMNMQIILHAPSTVKTSLTRPLFNWTSARMHHHSSMPRLFQRDKFLLSVPIITPHVNSIKRKKPGSAFRRKDDCSLASLVKNRPGLLSVFPAALFCTQARLLSSPLSYALTR